MNPVISQSLTIIIVSCCLHSIELNDHPDIGISWLLDTIHFTSGQSVSLRFKSISFDETHYYEFICWEGFHSFSFAHRAIIFELVLFCLICSLGVWNHLTFILFVFFLLLLLLLFSVHMVPLFFFSWGFFLFS